MCSFLGSDCDDSKEVGTEDMSWFIDVKNDFYVFHNFYKKNRVF